MTAQDTDRSRLEAELTKIEEGIAAQEKLRGILPDEQLEAALTALQNKQAALQAQLIGSGQVVQGEQSVGVQQAEQGQAIVDSEVRGDVLGAGARKEGDKIEGGQVIVIKDNATVVFDREQPVEMPAVDRRSALGRYLRHVISRNRYLQLQGIRSGGKLVHIELDQIYVTLRATRQRVVQAEEKWLAHEAALAPGEIGRMAGRPETTTETVTVSVNEALADYARLVVLGDPGSGKTTLLRFLALLYARDLAEKTDWIRQKLGLSESGMLPVLLPLRQIGIFLKTRPDEGTEGHALLLEFLFRSLKNERIELPADFFDEALNNGQAVILLDGLDEVADPQLRGRVSRLVEAFTCAYPNCRYVVTSRIVGYTGPARLGEEYATTAVRDFTLDDVEHFLVNWHRLIAISQMGAGQSAESFAAEQTRQLQQAIATNQRIRELAINPLLLTVIALVHRDRVKLPDRRAELYAEAVDVLLGKWDEARGVGELEVLEGQPFDTGDKRLMLQNLALHMHQQELKEIAIGELRQWLGEKFYSILTTDAVDSQKQQWRIVERTVNRFLRVIEERTGLLVARGEGVYAFSHLTFQEYLAALAVAGRNDYVAYTLKQSPYPWWREVILLEAGYLSTQSQERTTHLIEAIANLKAEPEPYHNLVLAADCLQDVGSNRVGGNLQTQVQQRLRQALETPPSIVNRWLKRFGSKGWLEQRSVAIETLVKAGAGFWTRPYGEPEWITIPAGEFWLGSGDSLHKLHLDTFQIARTSITNAQYQLFVQATGHKVPEHWEEGRPPKGKESHPVANVTWHDAQAYCQWLSRVTNKPIALPSEAEWEKAARGNKDQREYPWGDTFESNRCNTRELGLGDTAPAGVFLDGASPYGCLDMSGNVWEWTRSIYRDYPYDPNDGRESQDETDAVRVLRGGSWDDDEDFARCSIRNDLRPSYWFYYIGFRVVVSPIS